MSKIQVAQSGNISCYYITTDLVGVAAVNGVLVVSFVRPARKNIVGYAYTATQLEISFVDDFQPDQIQAGEGAPKLSSDAIFQTTLEVELETIDVDWLGGVDPSDIEEDIIDNYVLDLYELLQSSEEFEGKNDPKAMDDFLSKRLFYLTATHSYDKSDRGFITNPESASFVINRPSYKTEQLEINVLQKDVNVFLNRPGIESVKTITSVQAIEDEEMTANFQYVYQDSSVYLYKIEQEAFEKEISISDDNADKYILLENKKLPVEEKINEDDPSSDQLTLTDILKIEKYNVEEKLNNVIDTTALYGIKIEHNYEYDDNSEGIPPRDIIVKIESGISYFKWEIEQEDVSPKFFWAKSYPSKVLYNNTSGLLMVYTSVPKKEFKWYNGKNPGEGTLVKDADPREVENNIFTYSKAWLQVSTFDPTTLSQEDFNIELDLEQLAQEEQNMSRIITTEEKDYYLFLLRDMPKNIYSARLQFEYENEGVLYRTKPIETLVAREREEEKIEVGFDWHISPTHKGYSLQVKVPPKLQEGEYLEQLDPDKRISNVNGLNNFMLEYKDVNGAWQPIAPIGTEELLQVEYTENQSPPPELQDVSIPRQHRIQYMFIEGEEQKTSDWYYSPEWQYLSTEYPAPYNLFVAADEENERYIVGFDRRWLHHEVPDKPYSTQQGVVLPKYALHYKLPSEEEYTVYDIIQSTRATDNGESLSVEVDVPFADLTIDLTKSYVFKLYNIYDDNNKDIQEIQSLPATFMFTVSSSSKVTIKPYEFIFNETKEKYKLSFYRNFLWSEENGQTEGTLGDEYTLVNYRLRYKKDIDSAWSEYLFDDTGGAEGITTLDYVDPEGIVRVSHEITKSDTAPLQLEEAPYEMEIQIIYSITEGDPPETTEYVSEPSRFKLFYSQTKTHIKPYEFIFVKKDNLYEISFYRDFFWNGENGMTGGTLADSYTFINYRLRYKKEADTAWTEYDFNEINSVIEYPLGIDLANITHLVDANPDTSPIPLDDAPYLLELAIIYSITEGTPPVTTEFTSPPSRFYRTYNTESMSYIFDADLENIKHPKVGKWDIANMIGNGNGTLTVEVSYEQIGAALKDYTFFNLNIVDVGAIADGGAGSVYTNTSPTHTLSLDEYAGTGTDRKPLEYLSFEIELVGIE